MIGGKVFLANVVSNGKAAFVAVDARICYMTPKLNRVLDIFQPSAHTIHQMLNYTGSDSMLLIFNKKRLILYNSESKEVVNFCDYPENTHFLTAVSSQYGTFVCLRKINNYVLYKYEDNALHQVYTSAYYQIAVFQSKSCVYLCFWNNLLLLSDGRAILSFRYSAPYVPYRFDMPAKVTQLQAVGDFAFVGYVQGQIYVFRGSFSAYPISLNFHHNAIISLTPLPCEGGFPVVFSSDFDYRIAKWIPSRNSYKRTVIGPLLSCCYNLSFPSNGYYLYAQLDCNKIVVFDPLSVKQEFVLSSCPSGRNTLSRPLFFTPKIRNKKLMFYSVPGSVEVVENIFAPFYSSTVIHLYTGYSNSDMIFSTTITQDYLPQVKFFDIMLKNKVVAILESYNERFFSTQLVIGDLQGNILFYINGIIPEAATQLFINEREIYVCCSRGYLKLYLDGDQLAEQGFYLWQQPGAYFFIDSIQDEKLCVFAGDEMCMCREEDNELKVFATEKLNPEAEVKQNDDFLTRIDDNLSCGEYKGQFYLQVKHFDSMEQEQAVSMALVDGAAFQIPKQAEILISNNNKMRINHASHQLPLGDYVLAWTVESLSYY